MEANEAPKRLYVNIYDHLTQKGYYAFTNKVTENDIEYTRTDAFIEKACDWFRRIDYDDNIPPFETTEEFIEGFKKAMKL